MAKQKIVIDTIIKSCNTKADGESLNLEKMNLTDAQREQFIVWVKEKADMKVTFQPLQENLPGM